MKSTNFLIAMLMVFILIAFISPPVKAQGVVGVVTHDYGTVANSVDESYVSYRWDGLIRQFGCNKIDSLHIALTTEGETDIDSLDWYPCNWAKDGTVVKGTVATKTVTLNVAASAYGTEVLLATDAGVLSPLWRGYEGFTLMTRGAAAGNDAGDPNSLMVTIVFFGD